MPAKPEPPKLDAGGSRFVRPKLLSDLSPKARAAFFAACREQVFQPGETLFEQESAHTLTYVIEQGLIRTYYTAQSGREVTLCYWSDGDFVGGPDFFGNSLHIWSGIAMRRTRTLAITGERLRTLAARSPEMALWVAEFAMFKLKWISLLFQVHCTESVLQRLAYLILMLNDIYGVTAGNARAIRHQLSQGDLSTLLGTSRQWTNKVLGELKARGLMRIEQGHIVILDADGLARIARGEG